MIDTTSLVTVYHPTELRHFFLWEELPRLTLSLAAFKHALQCYRVTTLYCTSPNLVSNWKGLSTPITYFAHLPTHCPACNPQFVLCIYEFCYVYSFGLFFLDSTGKWNAIRHPLTGLPVLLQMARFHSFHRWVVFRMYVYTHKHTWMYSKPLFIRSSVNRHFRGFQILAIVNAAAMNVEVRMTFSNQCFHFFTWVLRGGTAGARGGSIFNLLRNCHTVLHRGCTYFHSHQQPTRVPSAPRLANLCHLLSFRWTPFWQVSGDVSFGFVCISLVIGDVEHLFMYLLGTCINWNV